ncbi:MAG: NAD-dependent epimerase/dehydratase family protein [Anaerolineales bacterium]|nr:MAG: NAD-dependent epimerase/dehydratase family protein [Anaerolineales bacterium]
MKALVTGGGGFLGRAIVNHLLQRGDEVTVFARGAYPELEKKGARLIQGDIQDLDAITQACQRIDTVFHVAAKAGLWGDWDDFYGVNVTGTENVITASRTHSVPRLIYTSSPSVIFDGADQCGVDESYPYPTHYENAYPHTKALGEQRVLEANSHNMLTTSLRPHLIFGPGDNHLLPSLLARARQGKVPQIGEGTNKVDLTYVEDAARAHLLAADALHPGSPVAGSAYFISQDEPVVLWSWINDLLAALEIHPIRMKLPLWLARAAGAWLVAVHHGLHLHGEPRITPFLASELAQNHYYDITRAKRDFGYHPTLTMAQATETTIAWLKTGNVAGFDS